MTEAAAIVRPKLNLNRAAVAVPQNQRSGPDFIDFTDYGTYTLALRHWQYKVGERSGKAFYLACAHVLESTNPKWPVGRDMGIYFQTGRMGDLADMDDFRIAEFIRAVAKLPPAPAEVDANGAKIDTDAENDKAIALGKVEHNKFTFRLIRGHDKPKSIPVLANGKPTFNADGTEAVEIKKWTRDKFEIV